MVRRRGREPTWPMAVLLGCIVGGVALGTALTGDRVPNGPAHALEDGVDDGEPGLPTPWDRIRVEVLNAGGITGAAARAKDVLRDDGFDVVYYGNAPSFGRDSSVVLARTGGREGAQAVGRSLGVDRVRIEPDSTLLVDVTVLLGRDVDFLTLRADEVISGER